MQDHPVEQALELSVGPWTSSNHVASSVRPPPDAHLRAHHPLTFGSPTSLSTNGKLQHHQGSQPHPPVRRPPAAWDGQSGCWDLSPRSSSSSSARTGRDIYQAQSADPLASRTLRQTPGYGGLGRAGFVHRAEEGSDALTRELEGSVVSTACESTTLSVDTTLSTDTSKPSDLLPFAADHISDTAASSESSSSRSAPSSRSSQPSAPHHPLYTRQLAVLVVEDYKVTQRIVARELYRHASAPDYPCTSADDQTHVAHIVPVPDNKRRRPGEDAVGTKDLGLSCQYSYQHLGGGGKETTSVFFPEFGETPARKVECYRYRSQCSSRPLRRA